MTPEVPTRTPTLEDSMARFRETGDPEALGALFDATAPGLFRLALTLVPDPASAEDAVQETFLAALEASQRFDPERPVLPWLVGILHHKAARVRDRVNRAPDPVRLPHPAAPGDPADLAGDREEEERVRAALDELPEPYREVALLRWRHGLEPAEIAALKRTSPGTIRSHLHRGLEKVRRRMAALPALLFARSGERQARGLDAVRRTVMTRAAEAVPVAAGAGGAAAAGAVGGILMANKAVAAGLVVLLAAGAWWALRDANRDAGSPTVGTTPAPVPTKAPAAAAPVPVPAAPPATETTASDAALGHLATGLVVDREDRPVADALVLALPDNLPNPVAAEEAMAKDGPGRAARTDAAGRFRVPLPGTTALSTLYVEAAGFAPTVETEVPLRGAEVRIVLDRPASLAGLVRDLSGRPVPGARVRLVWAFDAARVLREAVSGADGAYRIEGVPPRSNAVHRWYADALVAVEADGFAPLMVTQAFMDPLGKFGGAGEEGRLDLYLTRGSSLRGTVVDGETGLPFAGARVVLWSIESSAFIPRGGGTSFATQVLPWRALGETVSAADGSFRFDRIPANGKNRAASFNVGKKGLTLGYVGAMKEGWAPASVEVPFADEGAVQEATLSLWPAAAVTGRVVEADGRPVPGAGVRVEVEGRRENAWIPPDLYPGVPSVAGRTDAAGRYRVEGVRAEREKSSAARVLAARGGTVLQNEEGGVPIDVRAGKITEAPDLVLEEPPDLALAFRVVDEAGAPIWGAEVKGEIQAFTGRTDREGLVRLHSPVYSGGGQVKEAPEIVFTVRARGYGGARATATPSRENPPEVRVVLEKGHSVAGIVREADGSPTAETTQVFVARGDMTIEEAFRIPPGAREPVGRLGWTSCSSNGRFRIEDLPAGPYHVMVNRFPKVLPNVASIRQGASGPLRFTAMVSGVASDTADLAVVLPPEVVPVVQPVEGTVVDAVTGEPVGLQWAALWKGEETAAGGKDPARPGAFRFPAVTEGTWTLLVHARGYAGSSVEGIVVRAGAPPEPISVRMEKGATVRGVLRPPAGISLDGREAVFADPSRPAFPVTARLDDQGRFEAAGFRPGRYGVSVPSREFPRAGPPPLAARDARALVVPEGASSVPFEVDLVPSGDLYVRIRDPRLPPDPSGGEGPPTSDQVKAGKGARLEIRDGAGALVAEKSGLTRGTPFFGLPLPEGEYVVRLLVPGGDVREERTVVQAGGRASVKF